jgi:hypothetical protein
MWTSDGVGYLNCGIVLVVVSPIATSRTEKLKLKGTTTTYMLMLKYLTMKLKREQFYIPTYHALLCAKT